MEDIINQLAADVFEADVATVQASDFFFDLDQWDSLSHVVFIGAVETAFGIKFDANVIFDLTSRSDLMDAIGKLKQETMSA